MPDSDDDVVLEWDAPGAAALMGVPGAEPRSTPGGPKSTPGGPKSSPKVGAGSVPISGIARCRLDIAGITSPGRVRPRNEDSFLIQRLGWCNLDQYRDLALTIVADGVGSYEAGDQASGLLIRIVGNALAPLLTGTLTGQLSNVTPAQISHNIDNALLTANRTIFQRAQGNPNLKNMASTVAVVMVWDGQVVIGHVGDCRVYHHRGSLTQVTRDQTLVARMVALGQLTPQEAARHPNRNEVAQAVGRHPEVAPAAHSLRAMPGDWLVVACDGLHAHVDARTLDNVLRQGTSAVAVAQQLVDLANQGGGSDNVTVVAIRCY